MTQYKNLPFAEEIVKLVMRRPNLKAKQKTLEKLVRSDRELLKSVIEIDPVIYSILPEELRDYEVSLMYANLPCSDGKYIPANIFVDHEDIVEILLKRECTDPNEDKFSYLPPEIRNQKKFAIMAVENNPKIIRKMWSENVFDEDLDIKRRWGADKDVVLSAISKAGENVMDVYPWVGMSIADDYDILEKVLPHCNKLKDIPSLQLNNGRNLLLFLKVNFRGFVRYMSSTTEFNTKESKEQLLLEIKDEASKIPQEDIISDFVDFSTKRTNVPLEIDFLPILNFTLNLLTTENLGCLIGLQNIQKDKYFITYLKEQDSRRKIMSIEQMSHPIKDKKPRKTLKM